MKPARLLIPTTLILTILLSPLLSSPSLPSVRAQGTTVQVWSEDFASPDVVEPALGPGSIFVLDIMAIDLPPIVDTQTGGINGFDIVLNYDSSILKATAAEWEAPLCPASENCLFDPLNPIMLIRDVDVPAGNTRVVVVVLGDERATGTGTLLRVRFEVVGVGFTTIDLREDVSTLSGPVNGQVVSIPYAPVDGHFENRIPFILSTLPPFGSVASGQSLTVEVSVTQVWTIQDFTETIGLATGPVPQDTFVSFNPSTGTANFTSQLTITTSSTTPAGVYDITITGISAVSSHRNSIIFRLTVGVQDIEVLDVAVSSDRVVLGDDVVVAVTVKNGGSRSETFTVNLQANDTMIETRATTVGSQQTVTLTFTWPTAGYALGAYLVIAQVPPLPGEIDVADNTLTAGYVRLAADFRVSLSQSSGVLIQGDRLRITVNAERVSTAGEGVILSVSGLPSGVLAAFDPSSGLPPFSSFLTITAAGDAATGTYTLQVIGNSTSLLVRTATFTLTVISAHDVAVTNVTPNPALITPGETVTISVVVTNQGASTESFTVTAYANNNLVGSFNVASLAAGETRTISIAWSTSGLSSGLYTVNARIPPVQGEQDTADNVRDSETSVRLNSPPTPLFNWTPASIVTGQEASFDASQSSDSDGSIPSYQWNFGDGTPMVTGRTVAHTFQSSGSFNITLTVTDNYGTIRTLTRTVEVGQGGGFGVSFLTSPAGLAGIAVAILLVLGGVLFYLRSKKPASSKAPR